MITELRYLDIFEVLPVGADMGTIRAEDSGIPVADEADARAKLVAHAAPFIVAGLTYEAWYHVHLHSDIPSENQICPRTKLYPV